MTPAPVDPLFAPHPADEKTGIQWPFICYQCGREFSVRVHLGVTPSKHVPYCVLCMEAAK